jgi:hypothetical protein
MIRNIYVSYTNEMLPDYVQAAIDGIERLALRPQVFDRFRTHYTNRSPLEMMRAELEQADVFIAVLGRRYGGIPGVDMTGQPNTHDYSYIELEYRLAGELNIPRFVFVAADHLGLDQRQQSAPGDRQSFEAFLKMMMAEQNVFFYDSPQDMVIELMGRLGSEVRVESIFGDPSRDPQFRADVFMMMPFKPKYKPVYEIHVTKVVKARGLTINRGDDFFANHAVINDIWAAVARCRLVIADCTEKNPNVFYEIGMAHTLGKPCILIAQALKYIPFDVRHLRTIIYTQTDDGLKAFEPALDEAIVALLRLPTP